MLTNFFVTERLIHSLKTAIAISIAYALAQIIGTPADQWIVISTTVVMCAQIYVGGMMQKSYLRLLGTLLGCLMATVTIVFFNPTFMATLITFAIAGFIFSYIATTQENLSQMATLGVVTTMIILFSNQPTIWFAVLRFLEISAGIVIAAVVSQFIFPIHARTHLRRAQAGALGLIRNYYSAAFIDRFTSNDRNELDENIIKSLLKQRQLANDSAPELIGKRFDPDHFAHTLHCEREILRAINFMDMALSRVKGLKSIYDENNPLTQFNKEVTQALDELIRVLRTNQLGTAHLHIPDLRPLLNALFQHPNLMDPEQRIYLDGFVFSAEILVKHLKDLAALYKIPVSPEPLPG